MKSKRTSKDTSTCSSVSHETGLQSKFIELEQINLRLYKLISEKDKEILILSSSNKKLKRLLEEQDV